MINVLFVLFNREKEINVGWWWLIFLKIKSESLSLGNVYCVLVLLSSCDLVFVVGVVVVGVDVWIILLIFFEGRSFWDNNGKSKFFEF